MSLEDLDPDEARLWRNPDIPSLEAVYDELKENGPDHLVEFECPYPVCTETVYSGVPFAEDADTDMADYTFEEFIAGHVKIYVKTGTVRCKNCDEPLVGIRGHRTGGPEL